MNLLPFCVALLVVFVVLTFPRPKRPRYTVADLDPELLEALKDLRLSFPNYVLIGIYTPQEVVLLLEPGERAWVWFNEKTGKYGLGSTKRIGVLDNHWWLWYDPKKLRYK